MYIICKIEPRDFYYMSLRILPLMTCLNWANARKSGNFINQSRQFWMQILFFQVVNVPGFVVRLDSQKHIDFSLKSPFGGGRAGRVKRKNARKGDGGEEDEE